MVDVLTHRLAPDLACTSVYLGASADASPKAKAIMEREKRIRSLPPKLKEWWDGNADPSSKEMVIQPTLVDKVAQWLTDNE